MIKKENKDLSLAEFIKRFSSIHECVKYYKNIRWREGEIFCLRCGCDKIYVTNIGFRCSNRDCQYKFNYASATLFECSKIPLTTWFLLFYLSAIQRKNISSVQMAKNLGITQKSAWNAMHDMRVIFHEDVDIVLSGTVEVDECYLAKNKWRRWGGGVSVSKAPIIGMIERNGLAIIKCLENRDYENVRSVIKKHITSGTNVFTDGWIGYRFLNKEYFHDYVIHCDKEFVRGDIHTNSIEGLWSMFKKSIRNAHHSIGPYHVQRYCDEAAYKHNTRNLSTWDRFNDMLSRSDFTKEKSIYNLTELLQYPEVIPMYKVS